MGRFRRQSAEMSAPQNEDRWRGSVDVVHGEMIGMPYIRSPVASPDLRRTSSLQPRPARLQRVESKNVDLRYTVDVGVED